MRFPMRAWLASAVSGCLMSAVATAAQSPTIGDVLKRPVEIRTGERVTADPERARQNYEAFLSLSAADEGLRADAMRRLGDLKLEAGEEERIGRDLTSGAPLSTRDAIALYSRLLESVPDYPRTDAVLYQLARAYESAGDLDASSRTLGTLVRRFPRSNLAAEAQFRRGEIFFSAHRWPEAEGAYQALLANAPNSEFVEQATYKLGWSRFKSGDNEGALDAFVRLLDRQLIGRDGAEVDLDSFTRPRRELIEDTLRVSAVIFSIDEAATGVEKFLARVGSKPYSDLLYATLGDLYAAKERWTDAAVTYSAFARHEPLHERAPLLQSVAIDVYRRGGFAQLVLAAKRNYVEQYRLTSPFWQQRRTQDMPLVVRELKQNLQDLAAYYHEQAQSTKAPGDYQEAAHWYREFLDQFPADPAAAESAYLLSDALFESHRYADAADEYLKVAYDYPESPRSATAAYAAVVALEKEEGEATGEEKARLHRLSLETSLRFGKAYPAHPESGSILVRTARQYLADHDYSHALEVADLALARRDSLTRELQRDAWTVSMNAFFETSQYDKAESAGLQVLQLMSASDPQRGAMEDRIAAAIYRQGEVQRDARAWGDAAATFLRIHQQVPHASVVEVAEYDAAAAYLSAERWTDAIEVLERYRRDYPKSARQSEVTRRLAGAYLATKNSTTAAQEFERIAQQADVDSATRREALAQAAELYDKAGDVPRAAAAIETYLRRYPEPFETAIEFRQKLIEYASTGRDPARRANLLEELVRVEAAGGATRSDRSRYLAAKASLELAAAQRDAFASVKLVLPLKRSLEAKRTALQKALRAYETADGYAVAEVSTAATFEMAELYRRLGVDLLKSERPKALSGEALEQYDLLLEEQAFPFEEKAIALHELNAARASSGIYDEFVRQSFDALSRLKPARYAKQEAPEELTIDLLAGAAGTATLEESVRFQEAVARATADPALADDEFKALGADKPVFAGPLLNRAVIAFRQGRYSDADKVLILASELSAANATILSERALVLRHMGRFAEAESLYRSALQIEPDSVRSRRNFGVLLDLFLARPQDAVAEWRRAIELEGGDKELEVWVAESSRRIPSANHPESGGTP
jgi:cellulose synthase operon protein C